MKTLILLAALTCSAQAVAPPSTASPAILWSLINPQPAVSIPTASEYLTRYGVAVQTYSDSLDVEAFLVTVSYHLPESTVVVQQTQLVQRTDRTQWTAVVFWTSQPVVVVSVRAQGLVTKESSEVR